MRQFKYFHIKIERAALRRQQVFAIQFTLCIVMFCDGQQCFCPAPRPVLFAPVHGKLGRQYPVRPLCDNFPPLVCIIYNHVLLNESAEFVDAFAKIA